MSEEKKEAVVSQSEYDWLSRRVDRIERSNDEAHRNILKKLRLLLRILVDKKIIGPEVAKSIEESFHEGNENILDWYRSQLDTKKKE